MSNYKDSLLTPTTEFEMRANLVAKEPNIQQQWNAQDVVNQANEQYRGCPEFVLHDGPPYANGNLHIGHGLNKILKDIVVRSHNYQGMYTPWICGWDTHGLPIEVAVTKSGVNRKEISPMAFRQKCREYAQTQVANQIEQFKPLGLFTDFRDRYVTLDFSYELTQLELFKTMVDKKLVYRHMKPIYWSCSSESALAEAEIEYQELTSPSIYVKFTVVDSKGLLPANTSVVIWTTTPWTIPANQLLAVGEEIQYGLYRVGEEHFVIAQALAANVQQAVGWTDLELVKDLTSAQLVGLNTQHPLYDRFSQIVIGHHVTTEAGTGIVHIASGFGEDDYQIALNNGLEVFAPIDDQGKFTKNVEDQDLIGIFYEDANKIVGTKLAANNKLLKLKFMKHQYPVDWRTKKPVIYRATNQWFVSVESLKDQLAKAINDVNWEPKWARERMLKMIANRADWCISRQRLWGVPIIAFYNELQEPQINGEIIDYVLTKFKDAQTTDIWFEQPADFFLPEKYRNLGWKKEQDIMDVWFDSGVSHLAVIKNRGLKHPVDVYLEGSDQFRGWFNSSLITSVIATGHAPYRNVLPHGFVNDEQGRKMSKSIGNTVTIEDTIKQYGADVLRLWVASTNYADDVKIGPEILKQVSESYRKIRNTLRFLLGNLNDFNPVTDQQPTLHEVDDYLLFNLHQFQTKVWTAYNQFDFNRVYNLINNFVNNDLSSFYLDFIKDILYVEAVDGLRRRQVQTTLYRIYRVLIDAIKPILVHTTEEAHNFIQYEERKTSVHLESLFTIQSQIDAAVVARWDDVLLLLDDVHKALETARNDKVIKKSLEASLKITLKPEYAHLAQIADLHQIFIVSELEFTNTPTAAACDLPTAFVEVTPMAGEKCNRCWVVVKNLHNGSDLCERCYNLIHK